MSTTVFLTQHVNEQKSAFSLFPCSTEVWTTFASPPTLSAQKKITSHVSNNGFNPLMFAPVFLAASGTDSNEEFLLADLDGTLHRISVFVDCSTDSFHSSTSRGVQDAPACARFECTKLNIRFVRHNKQDTLTR